MGAKWDRGGGEGDGDTCWWKREGGARGHPGAGPGGATKGVPAPTSLYATKVGRSGGVREWVWWGARMAPPNTPGVPKESAAGGTSTRRGAGGMGAPMACRAAGPGTNREPHSVTDAQRNKGAGALENVVSIPPEA